MGSDSTAPTITRAPAGLVPSEVADACRRTSVAAVAKALGKTQTEVRAIVARYWVEAGKASARSGAAAALAHTNDERRRTAADMVVPAARRALASGVDEAHHAVLWARIDHPDLPLSGVAEQIGMTKDAYAGRLRRALQAAGEL